MSNPSNNFSSDLDPYDRLAQMYGVGLFDLLPLPPSWSNYVRAQYAPDPALFSAPAPAIPGFRKLPDLMEAQALIGSGSPGFDPLPAAPLPIEPSPLFPSELPGLDKAIARINAPTPGFHLTPGLGGFTRNASGPALSLPPLPPPLLTPSGGGFGALGSGLPPTMPAPQQQPTSFNAPGLPPNTGFSDPSGFVRAGYPSAPLSPPMAGPQAAPASTPPLVLAQANSMPMSGPGPMSRPIGAPSEAPADPNDIYARMNRQQPQMSVPAVPHPEPQAVQNVEPPTPGDKAWQATKDAASAINNGVNWTANYIQTVLAGALADTIGLPHTAGTAVDLLSEVTGLPFNDTVLMRPLMTIARALPSSEQASRELFEMVRTFDPDFQVKSIHPVVDAGLRGLLGGAINKALGAAIGLSGAANPTIDLGTAARKFGQSAGLEALKEVWPLLDQQTRNAVQRQIFFTANPPMQVPIGQPRGPVPGPGGGLGGPNWYIPPPSGR